MLTPATADRFEYAVPLSLAKDIRGEWVFSGPVSTQRRDFQGEVVLRQAVQRGLHRWKQRGMPFDFNHRSMRDPDDPTNYPGEGVRIYEDDHKGDTTDFVEGRLFKHNPYARETKGRLDRGEPVYLSIGGRKRVDGATVVDTDIDHVAITWNPANPDCAVGWSAFCKSMGVMEKASADGALPDVITRSFTPPISESPEEGRTGPARKFGQPYISKAAARYREGVPPVCCKNCTHYAATEVASCEIVTGPIGEDDLCNHFDPITIPLSTAGSHPDKATWSSSKDNPGGGKGGAGASPLGKSAEIYVRNRDGSLSGRSALSLPPGIEADDLAKMLTAGAGPGLESSGGRSLVEEDLEGSPSGRARRRHKAARKRKGFPAEDAATAGNRPSPAAQGHSEMGKSVLPGELQDELTEVAESNTELSPLAKALSFFGFDLAKRRDRDRRAESEDEDEGDEGGEDEGEGDEDYARDEDEGEGDEGEGDEEEEEENAPPPARRAPARMGKNFAGLPEGVELVDEADLLGAVRKMNQRHFNTLAKTMTELAKSQASVIERLDDLADQYGRQPRRSQTGGNPGRGGRQQPAPQYHTRGTVTLDDPLVGGTGSGVRVQSSPGAELAKSNDIVGTWVVIDRAGTLIKSKEGDELDPQAIRDTLEQACIENKITVQDVIRYVCDGSLPDEIRKKAGLTV